MRRRPAPRPAAQNLDSFLDIMTNTVGVLVFVLLFVTLAAADATVLVRTPLRAETEKTPVFFEAAGGRVIHVETKEGDAKIDAFLEGLPRITWYNARWVLNRIDGFSTTTPNYTIDFAGSGFGVRYRALAGAGEDARTVRDTASAYQRVLRKLDRETEYLAFIVRPDGLEAFRAARQVAAKRGVDSGWEPFADSRDLIFGSGGRQVGVQ